MLIISKGKGSTKSYKTKNMTAENRAESLWEKNYKPSGDSQADSELKKGLETTLKQIKEDK